MLRYKSPAKINIFLKIVGKRDNYHLINSRFIRYEKLFDEISFLKKDNTSRDFEIVGNFDCVLENNTIFKTYKFLREYIKDKNRLDEFFSSHYIDVQKNIPSGAGLGGGSSNAATFLLATNDMLDLKLEKDELYSIGERVGADVNFFLSEYKSANVSGVGEVVEEFFDDDVNIDLEFIDIHANTGEVYRAFREHFFKEIDINLAENMMKLKTDELLECFEPKALNDLLKPLLICYPKIKNFIKEDFYLSGSGSTFFKKAYK